jgi:CheY-like chemotaxis protein
MAFHVLLVDDDTELRTLSQNYLEQSGFRVSTASDGWDAIREIMVSKPDVVVMDVEMPKLSGLNALDILRVGRLTDHLPIIVTSAHGDKDTILRAVQLGADDFIVKPYSFSELSARLSVHLFHLNFTHLQTILTSLVTPNPGHPQALWSGIDISRYQNWSAFTAQFGEKELCLLLQNGLNLESACRLNEEDASRKILVLAKFRQAWKCVWPLDQTKIKAA